MNFSLAIINSKIKYLILFTVGNSTTYTNIAIDKQSFQRIQITYFRSFMAAFSIVTFKSFIYEKYINMYKKMLKKICFTSKLKER